MHAGGSRSIPTVHQRRQRRVAVGSPKSTTGDYNQPTRLNYYHGGGGGSLEPQIYDAETEVDVKIRYESTQETEAPKDQPSPTGSPTGSPAEIPHENNEKHPDHMFKVITHPEAIFRTSRR